MTPLFIDTTCNNEGGTSTCETKYDLLEEGEPRPLKTKVTTDGHVSSSATIFEMVFSFLHRITTRPNIIPYTYMVKSIIDQAEISDKEFKNRSQEVMGYFLPNNLRLMYHLPKPQPIYKKHFLENFSKENEDPTTNKGGIS